MIRPLRQRHRVMACALGVFLPAVFVVGIAARRPVPLMTSVPAELAGRPADFGEVIWTKANLWQDQRIITRLRHGVGGIAVELTFSDLARADVLVYWISDKTEVRDQLPDNARLLGVLNHAPLPLPDSSPDAAGRLVLYSLADHEIVAISRSFTLQTD